MNANARRLSLALWVIGGGMALLWLPSLDRYLGARYHTGLEPLLGWVLPAPWTDALLRRPGTGKPPPASTVAGHREQDRQTGMTQPPGQAPGPVPGESASEKGTRQAASAAPMPAGGDTVLVQTLPPGKYVPSLAQQKLKEGPQRILFAGDSMMQGVAPFAMRELSKQFPDWKMFDESRQSTGLTVRRYFDWPTRILELMDARDLTLVVVFLGPNDPWDIVAGGKRHIFPTESWIAHYASRVDEIQAAAKQRGIGVIWMGLPAMREPRVHDGAVLQNQIFHARAKAWGTDYLSTEPLIGLLSEPYQKFIKDDAGQALSLRAEDGIHFNTTALKRMSAALVHMITQSTQP